MAEISGYGGGVKWVLSDNTYSDANYNIYSWSMDLAVDPLEVTTFADAGNRTYIRGLKGWSGSMDAYVDGTNTLQPSDVGMSGQVQLVYSGTTNYRGDAFLTGIHPAIGVDGVVTQTMDFTGTGALTHSDVVA